MEENLVETPIKSPEARQRILFSALELFANNGFEKTSTREISLKANVNLSAIKYYFGDKAGLYRATYQEPMGCAKDDINIFTNATTIDETLKAIFMGFIGPLKESEYVKLCVKLHMREMVEPTGLWNSEIQNDLKPYHLALVSVLQRELGIKCPTEDIHRLAFSIISLGIFLYVGQDMITQIHPSLIDSHAALEEWSSRLVVYARAMIEAEKKIGKVDE